MPDVYSSLGGTDPVSTGDADPWLPGEQSADLQARFDEHQLRQVLSTPRHRRGRDVDVSGAATQYAQYGYDHYFGGESDGSGTADQTDFDKWESRLEGAKANVNSPYAEVISALGEGATDQMVADGLASDAADERAGRQCLQGRRLDRGAGGRQGRRRHPVRRRTSEPTWSTPAVTGPLTDHLTGLNDVDTTNEVRQQVGDLIADNHGTAAAMAQESIYSHLPVGELPDALGPRRRPGPDVGVGRRAAGRLDQLPVRDRLRRLCCSSPTTSRTSWSAAPRRPSRSPGSDPSADGRSDRPRRAPGGIAARLRRRQRHPEGARRRRRPGRDGHRRRDRRRRRGRRRTERPGGPVGAGADRGAVVAGADSVRRRGLRCPPPSAVAARAALRPGHPSRAEGHGRTASWTTSTRCSLPTGRPYRRAEPRSGGPERGAGPGRTADVYADFEQAAIDAVQDEPGRRPRGRDGGRLATTPWRRRRGRLDRGPSGPRSGAVLRGAVRPVHERLDQTSGSSRPRSSWAATSAVRRTPGSR